MIALEGDVAYVRFGKESHPSELAFGHPLLEVFAAQDIVEILHAVDLMLALFGRDEQADVIPPASGFGGVEGLACFGVNRGLVEGIEPPAPNRVFCFLVVLQLEFGAGRPSGAPLVGNVVHDAAIAAFRDVVVEL